MLFFQRLRMAWAVLTGRAVPALLTQGDYKMAETHRPVRICAEWWCVQSAIPHAKECCVAELKREVERSVSFDVQEDREDGLCLVRAVLWVLPGDSKE